MAEEKPIEDELDEAREDDGQIYVERDKIDFDPDDGLLSGTAFDDTNDKPDGDSESESDSDSGEPAQ